MAVLLYSAVNAEAMSLKDALQSENIVLDFRNGGTIRCSNINGDDLCSCHEYINSTDYVYSNNTYFLPVNNLPVLNNTCKESCISKIHILASIKGNSNISLQEYIPSIQNCKSNKRIFDGIVFCGDNSSFTGNLSLYPTITSITFENEQSVMSNINLPNQYYNKCKDQYKKQFPKMIDLCLPNNSYFGTLNITGNIMVVLSNESCKPVHISFNKINVPHNTLFVHDKVYIDGCHSDYHECSCNNHKNYGCKCHCSKVKGLRDINISSKNSESLVVPFKQDLLLHEDMKNQIIIELKQYMYNLIKISDKYRDNEVDIDILRESIRKLQCKLRTIQNVTDTANIQELENDITNLKEQINQIKGDIGTLNYGGPDLQTQINNKLQGGSGPVEHGDTQTQCTCGTDIAALKAAINGTAENAPLNYNKGKNIDARITTLESYHQGNPNDQAATCDCNCDSMKSQINEIKAAINGKGEYDNLDYYEDEDKCNIEARLTNLETKVGNPINTDGDGNIIPLQTQINNIKQCNCNCAEEISEIKGIIGGTTTGGVTVYNVTDEGGTLDARLDALEEKVGDGTGTTCDCSSKIDAINAAIISGTTAGGTLLYNTSEKGTIDARLTDLETKVGDTEGKDPLQEQINGLADTVANIRQCDYNYNAESGKCGCEDLGTKVDGLEEKIGDVITHIVGGNEVIFPLQDQIGQPQIKEGNTITQTASGLYAYIDSKACNCTSSPSSEAITCEAIRLMFKGEKETAGHDTDNRSDTTKGHCDHICEGFKAIITNEDKCTNICDAIGTLIQNERIEIHHPTNDAPHCTNICNALQLLITNEGACKNMCLAIKNLIENEKNCTSHPKENGATHCTNICSALGYLISKEISNEYKCENISNALKELAINDAITTNKNLNVAIQFLINNDSGNIDNAIAGLILKENSNIQNAIGNYCTKLNINNDTLKNAIKYVIQSDPDIQAVIIGLVNTTQG